MEKEFLVVLGIRFVILVTLVGWGLYKSIYHPWKGMDVSKPISNKMYLLYLLPTFSIETIGQALRIYEVFQGNILDPTGEFILFIFIEISMMLTAIPLSIAIVRRTHWAGFPIWGITSMLVVLLLDWVFGIFHAIGGITIPSLLFTFSMQKKNYWKASCKK
ncbi:hypothetical protein [Megasphaera cerevisiae]|jgi:hypothetical protein|uniref:hypothetical protein n=1 Tax=Megasphaera cerevisiae TaxID=39029 RepID=UPI000943339F|nr:hypothetical protein [Megasphaera cerevisiae]OKY52988.1 hypothetical protein BSR42_09900 [Megasphaera cerevisiae]